MALFCILSKVSLLDTSDAKALAFIMGSVSGKEALCEAIWLSIFRIAVRKYMICSGRGRELNTFIAFWLAAWFCWDGWGAIMLGCTC